MMFSTTLSKDNRPVCKKFMQDVSKLTLHGLRQHYVKLKDPEKNRKMFELLDVLEFNQVRIKLVMFLSDFYTIDPSDFFKII